jgi:hypothetical protein
VRAGRHSGCAREYRPRPTRGRCRPAPAPRARRRRRRRRRAAARARRPRFRGARRRARHAVRLDDERVDAVLDEPVRCLVDHAARERPPTGCEIASRAALHGGDGTERAACAALKGNRRRPTLPGGCPPSTIGPGRLNFSVRNGKRCFPAGMTAEIVEGRGPATAGAPSKLHSGFACSKSRPRAISTGPLNALLRVHVPPINVVVFHGPYSL